MRVFGFLCFWLGAYCLSSCSQKPQPIEVVSSDNIHQFKLNRIDYDSPEYQWHYSKLAEETSFINERHWVLDDPLPPLVSRNYHLNTRYQRGILSASGQFHILPIDAKHQPWNSVSTLVSTWAAFAALTTDGRVLFQHSDQMDRETQHQLKVRKDFIDITANTSAVAVLSQAGDILTWGRPANGGVAPSQPKSTEKVVRLFSNHMAFGALTEQQRFFSWGDFLGGGNIEQPIDNVVQVATTPMSFALLQATGQVSIWGDLAIKVYYEEKIRPLIKQPIFIIGNEKYLTIGTASGHLWVLGRREHQQYALKTTLKAEDIAQVLSSRNHFSLVLKSGDIWLWDMQDIREGKMPSRLNSHTPLLVDSDLQWVPTQQSEATLAEAF